MIVTFIGHAKIQYTPEDEKKLMKALDVYVDGRDVTFYMGLNGRFDWLAKKCCLKYKEQHSNAKVVFVTPYIDEAYLKNLRYAIDGFDEVLYPDLETVPKRYAIVARNRFMIDQADVVIVYLYYVFGNVIRFSDYASKKNKLRVFVRDM